MAMSKPAPSIKPRQPSSSQPRQDRIVPPMPSTFNSSSSAIKARRNSLRLSTQPPSVPIPPSLLQSPYLNTPKVHRDPPVHTPSEQDDCWLQDQIPVHSGNRSSLPAVKPRVSSGTQHQSPPLTPPVRPLSVHVGSGVHPGLSHIGDWRVTQRPSETASYPFPSPHWRKSSADYFAAAQTRSRSGPIPTTPSASNYFSDRASNQ